MAIALNQGPVSLFPKTILNEMVSITRKTAGAWRRHMHYQQIVSELGYFTDRQLADIGIHRCDIPRLAKQSADQLQRP